MYEVENPKPSDGQESKARTKGGFWNKARIQPKVAD